jgi:hypothetical protein
MVSLRLLFNGGKVVVVHGQAERMAPTAYPNNVRPTRSFPHFAIKRIVRPLTNRARHGTESALPHAT